MTWLSITSFILNYWKYIVPSVAAFAIGCGIAWYIQGVRVENRNVEIKSLRTDLSAAQTANKTNQETIKGLQKEIKSTSNICSSRLKVKDNVIAGLKHIDNLKPKTEGKDNEKDISAVDDPILHELNRMFSNKTDSKN